MKRMSVRRDSRDGWYTITPEDAEHLLKSDPIKNRPIGPVKVHRIADKIRDGRWVANGESIILDPSGKLADGQHRLSACIAANKHIDSYVVHIPQRLKDGFFDSVDQGAPRSGGDLLAMEGVMYSSTAAAVCRLLNIYEQGLATYGTGKGRTPLPTRELYARNKADVDHAVETVMMLKKELKGWARPGVMAFSYMMARRVNKEKAEKWINAVAFGEGLDASHPAMRLRKVLMADALNRGSKHYNLDAQIALVTKSWVLMNHGIKVQLLAWGQGQEEMPRFDDKPSRFARENLKEGEAA